MMRYLYRSQPYQRLTSPVAPTVVRVTRWLISALRTIRLFLWDYRYFVLLGALLLLILWTVSALLSLCLGRWLSRVTLLSGLYVLFRYIMRVVIFPGSSFLWKRGTEAQFRVEIAKLYCTHIGHFRGLLTDLIARSEGGPLTASSADFDIVTALSGMDLLNNLLRFLSFSDASGSIDPLPKQHKAFHERVQLLTDNLDRINVTDASASADSGYRPLSHSLHEYREGLPLFPGMMRTDLSRLNPPAFTVSDPAQLPFARDTLAVLDEIIDTLTPLKERFLDTISVEGSSSAAAAGDSQAQRERWLEGVKKTLLRCHVAASRFLTEPPVGSLRQMRADLVHRYEGEQIFFTASDGTRLDGVYLPQPSEAEARRRLRSGMLSRNEVEWGPTVVFANPNAGYYEVSLFQDEWVRFYHQHGLSVVLFNYRGFGRSQGAPSPATCAVDCEAVVAHVVQNGVKHIGVHGRSIGGICACHMAAKSTTGQLPQVKFVCVDRSFSSLASTAHFAFGPWARCALRVGFTGAANVKNYLTGRCTKVIISDCNDQIIPELAAIKTGVSIALCQLNEHEEGPHRQEHDQGEGEGASGAVRRICSSDMCRGMACPRRDEGVDLNECEAIAIAESERLKLPWSTLMDVVESWEFLSELLAICDAEDSHPATPSGWSARTTIFKKKITSEIATRRLTETTATAATGSAARDISPANHRHKPHSSPGSGSEGHSYALLSSSDGDDSSTSEGAPSKSESSDVEMGAGGERGAGVGDEDGSAAVDWDAVIRDTIGPFADSIHQTMDVLGKGLNAGGQLFDEAITSARKPKDKVFALRCFLANLQVWGSVMSRSGDIIPDHACPFDADAMEIDDITAVGPRPPPPTNANPSNPHPPSTVDGLRHHSLIDSEAVDGVTSNRAHRVAQLMRRRSRCLTYLIRREFKQRSKRLREQMMSPPAGGSTVHPLLQKVLSDLTVLDDFISALCRFFKLVDLPKATQPPASSSVDTPSPCYSPPFPHTYGRASQPPPPPPRAARPSQGCRCLMEAQGIDQDISRTTSTTTSSSRAAGTCGMASAGMAGELTEAEMTPQIDPRVTGYLLPVTCGHNGVLNRGELDSLGFYLQQSSLAHAAHSRQADLEGVLQGPRRLLMQHR